VLAIESFIAFTEDFCQVVKVMATELTIILLLSIAMDQIGIEKLRKFVLGSPSSTKTHFKSMPSRSALSHLLLPEEPDDISSDY